MTDDAHTNKCQCKRIVRFYILKGSFFVNNRSSNSHVPVRRCFFEADVLTLVGKGCRVADDGGEEKIDDVVP